MSLSQPYNNLIVFYTIDNIQPSYLYTLYMRVELCKLSCMSCSSGKIRQSIELESGGCPFKT